MTLVEMTEPQLFGYAEAGTEIEDERAERAAILMVEKFLESPFAIAVGLKKTG